MSKKYHILYKTTNIINNKCYVGVHSTNNLDDGYLGCGIHSGYDVNKFKSPRGIKFAFKKYGIHNFKREILHMFDSREEAFKKEAEIVDLSWVKSNDNYNLCLGGKNSGITIMPEEHKQKLIGIHSKEYIVVNIITGDVYENIKNITNWCRENLPELISFSSKTNKYTCKLMGVISKQATLYKNEWWACKKEDWTGEVVLKNKKVKSNIRIYTKNPNTFIHKNLTLINPEGEEVYIENLVNFCRDNNFDYTSFVKIVKGINKHAKFWTSSIKNHKDVVVYLMKDGNLIKIKNIKEYCRNNNLDSKSIFNLKNKKIDSYKGYTRYENEI